MDVDHWSEDIDFLREKYSKEAIEMGYVIPDSGRKKMCCMVMPENWIISSKSNFKKRWDYLVLGLAIYNSLTIPMD